MPSGACSAAGTRPAHPNADAARRCREPAAGILCDSPAARRNQSPRRADMSLRINDIAPDFEAETTQGKIRFHDWIGDKWAILFSHPKDFTPVCTTELGYMARIEPEFTKRNAKLIGLSADPVDRHAA